VGSTIYGMAETGGINNEDSTLEGYGTIYSYTPSTQQYATAHFFEGGSSDGRDPFFNGLYSNGSNIYGMTNAGGVHSAGATLGGTIFSFNPITGGTNVVHSFASNSTDANAPIGELVGSGTTLYGMTLDGGSSNDGTIFAFNTANNAVTVLHAFLGGTTDGFRPIGSLIESGSILYGTTIGGGAFGDGTVFAYDPATDDFSILHSFDDTDGANPYGALVLLNNTLYGTTASGGNAGDGVIFAVNLPEPGLPGLGCVVGTIILSRRVPRKN
jgi:uncharacterized repeat protein (TIGR03803 family)